MNKYIKAFQRVVLDAIESEIIPTEKIPHVSALRELVQKATPKKPNDRYWFIKDYMIGRCPNCNEECDWEMEYCNHCGQALDWSEDNGN